MVATQSTTAMRIQVSETACAGDLKAYLEEAHELIKRLEVVRVRRSNRFLVIGDE
jgi:hypothetical protein